MYMYLLNLYDVSPSFVLLYTSAVKRPTNINQLFFFFTALHGMQTRSSDENSARLSVRPSVSQMREL